MHYGRKTTGVKSKEEMNSLGLILPVFLSFLLDILLNILRSFVFSPVFLFVLQEIILQLVFTTYNLFLQRNKI